MAWIVDYAPAADRQLRKLATVLGDTVADFFDYEVAPLQNPTRHPKAKALKGPLKGLWRFDIGDYRAICDIQGKRLTILVLDIGHRRDVYR